MPSKKRKYEARFPPARIKKIMQTDEEIGKVAAAVPVIISRSLEIFLQSLIETTARYTNERKAKTMTTSHLKHCIEGEKKFDFLKYLVANIADIANQEEEDTNENGEKPKKPRKPRAPSERKKKERRQQSCTDDEDSAESASDNDEKNKFDVAESSRHSKPSQAPVPSTNTQPMISTTSHSIDSIMGVQNDGERVDGDIPSGTIPFENIPQIQLPTPQPNTMTPQQSTYHHGNFQNAPNTSISMNMPTGFPQDFQQSSGGGIQQSGFSLPPGMHSTGFPPGPGMQQQAGVPQQLAFSQPSGFQQSAFPQTGFPAAPNIFSKTSSVDEDDDYDA